MGCGTRPGGSSGRPTPTHRLPIDYRRGRCPHRPASVTRGAVRRAERLSREHWTLVYLHQHPDWRGEGVLVEKRLPRSTVLLPALALEARVKVADSVLLDHVLTVRLNGIDLPERAAYFKVG